jgi:hypothetical protein
MDYLSRLPGLDNQLDRGSFFVIDSDIGKRGNANGVNVICRQITNGDRYGFNSLIHGPGPNSLNLSPARLPHHPSNCPGHGAWLRLCRYLENFWLHPQCLHAVVEKR